MKWKEYILEGKLPTKSQVDKLVKAYALMVNSAKLQAGLKIEQKFHDAYRKQLDMLSKKFPNIDLDSDEFNNQIERKADKFWNSKAMRGAGVDW